MTKPQRNLYWKEWSKVRRACMARGLPIPDRHDLHVRALGSDKSSKELTNADLDQVLAEFLALSRPDDLASQLLQKDMPRRRLLYGITHHAPDPYWRSIARDKFGTDDLAVLDLVQLQQLKVTLSSRSRSGCFTWCKNILTKLNPAAHQHRLAQEIPAFQPLAADKNES